MQQRIDIYPTHRHGNFWLRAGRPFPFGATFVPGGVNFSIFSRHATACTLVLFHQGSDQPYAEIPFPNEFRTGHIFAMVVFDLHYEEIEYGYRFDGTYTPHEGHHFDPSHILLDPYAKAISGRNIWGQTPHQQQRARLVYDDFDWESDRPLKIPIEDLIIYEMHVRGFTRHPSANAKYPGTFAAIRKKIPYLKELGVNCIELMPIQEFDESESHFVNPDSGEPLRNYWGYSPVGFFAPKAGLAATGPLGMQVDEFKALVKLLHKNGIEVFLDVVFNHTAEGDETGHTLSLRGIDNKTYYMLRPDGRYYNFSGCGNTLNCNNPVVRNMVLDCLRYWVSEFHIDGFRFDLASILGRDANGDPLANPPLLEAMAHDPILGDCKLIAEAWDAGGLYQVGTFPSYGRWSEWNGKYRDTLRQFLRGDSGQAWEMAQRIQGSPDLYPKRGPIASVNFVTCHDGFSLADLFTYDHKHNWANGEQNRDGANDNNSWNCGWEGPTDDPAINQLRQQMMRNAIAILLTSQGIPLILMGDEVGQSKQGNNNTYCQDNELSWLNWELRQQNHALFRFFQQCIAFRHAHPILRNRHHFQHQDSVGSGYPDISWHSEAAWQPNWANYMRTMAFMLCGQHVQAGQPSDDYIYVAMNMHWETHLFDLPRLPLGKRWHLFANTAALPPHDICEVGEERLIPDQNQFMMEPRSVVILVGR